MATPQIADPNWAQLLNQLQVGPTPTSAPVNSLGSLLPQAQSFAMNQTARDTLANLFASSVGNGSSNVDLSGFLGGNYGSVTGSLNPNAANSLDQVGAAIANANKNNVQGVREGMLSGAVSGFESGGPLGALFGAVIGGGLKDQQKSEHWQNHTGAQGTDLNNPANVIFNPGAALLAKLGAGSGTVLGDLANPSYQIANALGLNSETPGTKAYNSIKNLDPTGGLGRSLSDDQINGSVFNAIKSGMQGQDLTNFNSAFGGSGDSDHAMRTGGAAFGSFIQQTLTQAKQQGLIPDKANGAQVYQTIVAPALDSYLGQHGTATGNWTKYANQQGIGFVLSDYVDKLLNPAPQAAASATPAPAASPQPVMSTPLTAPSIPSLSGKLQPFTTVKESAAPSKRTTQPVTGVGFGNGGGAMGIQTQRFVRAL